MDVTSIHGEITWVEITLLTPAGLGLMAVLRWLSGWRDSTIKALRDAADAATKAAAEERTASASARREHDLEIDTMRRRQNEDLEALRREIASLQGLRTRVTSLEEALTEAQETLDAWRETARDLRHYAGNQFQVLSAQLRVEPPKLPLLPRAADILAWRDKGGVEGHLDDKLNPTHGGD